MASAASVKTRSEGAGMTESLAKRSYATPAPTKAR
jgi:hypothetical protein